MRFLQNAFFPSKIAHTVLSLGQRRNTTPTLGPITNNEYLGKNTLYARQQRSRSTEQYFGLWKSRQVEALNMYMHTETGEYSV